MKMTLLSSFLISALFLSSCATPPEEPYEIEEGESLRMTIITDPPCLNPQLAHDTTSGNVIEMLFDGLTRRTADGNVELSVAEKVTISKDQKNYLFELRDSLWSDGSKVTAYDFEYSWKKALDPSYAAAYGHNFYHILNAKKAFEGKVSIDEVGIKALDEKRLEVTLVHPTPFFLDLTANWTFYPINRAVSEKNEEWYGKAGPDYVSNGPFVLKRWHRNNKLIVVKNQNYWDRDAVILPAIELSVINDHNTELNMFFNDEIDLVGEPFSFLPFDAVFSLRENRVLNRVPLNATFFYFFNTEVYPLNNKNIRKALSLAINRNAIVTHILADGPTAAYRLLPPGLRAGKRDHLFKYDKEKAKRLFEKGLKELGLSKEKFPTLTLSYNTDEGHHVVSQYIQEQWEKIFGITIKLKNLEWKLHLAALNSGDFQIGRCSWVPLYNDPLSFLDRFEFPDTSWNLSNWKNEEFSSLIRKSRETTNPEKRMAILEKAEEVLLDDMPTAPIYYLSGSSIIHPRVKNIIFNGSAIADFKYAYLDRTEEGEG